MNNKKRRIIGWILAAAACVCAVLAVRGYLASRNAGAENEKIREAVEAPAASSAERLPESTPSEGSAAESAPAESTAAAEAVPIDFAALAETCPDAYAWIRIDGTNVDYPIVQSTGDQSYYLTHSAEQEKSSAGAIFTEDLNGKDFTDPVTVIYGHNMKNGSMFETLHRFEDRAFFNEHREILVYLPEKVLHFRIFAAYNTDDRSILRSYNFSDTAQYQRYLDFVTAQKSMTSIVADDVTVTTADRIIILSTCNGNSSQRYLVQAVEVGS